MYLICTMIQRVQTVSAAATAQDDVTITESAAVGVLDGALGDVQRHVLDERAAADVPQLQRVVRHPRASQQHVALNQYRQTTDIHEPQK